VAFITLSNLHSLLYRCYTRKYYLQQN